LGLGPRLIKKLGSFFTSKFVGTGPSSYKKSWEVFLRVNFLGLGPRLIKKLGSLFTSKFVGTGTSSYKKVGKFFYE